MALVSEIHKQTSHFHSHLAHYILRHRLLSLWSLQKKWVRLQQQRFECQQIVCRASYTRGVASSYLLASKQSSVQSTRPVSAQVALSLIKCMIFFCVCCCVITMCALRKGFTRFIASLFCPLPGLSKLSVLFSECGTLTWEECNLFCRSQNVRVRVAQAMFIFCFWWFFFFN